MHTVDHSWEPVDPVVADPVRQDNDKRSKTYNMPITSFDGPFFDPLIEVMATNIYGNSLLNYTEGGDKTSQCSHLVELGPRQLGLPVAEYVIGP